MNYTLIYKKIYSHLKTDTVSHEQAHQSAIKITNAILDICTITEQQVYQVSEEIKLIVSDVIKARDGATSQKTINHLVD